MDIQFKSMARTAALPSKINDDWGGFWIGQISYTLKRVNKLLEIGVLKEGLSMFEWDISGCSGSVSIITPEDFKKNPVILVPPGAININRTEVQKGHVRILQDVLQKTITRNSNGVNPALGVIVNSGIARAHLLKAGYTKLTEINDYEVFIPRDGTNLEALRGVLKIH